MKNPLLTRTASARTISLLTRGAPARALVVLSLVACALSAQTPSSAAPNPVEAGRTRFNVRCAGCHGQDGLGGERAPAIGQAWRSRTESEATLRDTILHGIPDVGMPAFNVPDAELQQLVAFLQSRV